MVGGTLFTSPRSPFGRKALIGLIEAGVADGITIRHVVTTPQTPPPELLPFNPLGTIPVLVMADGEVVIDSTAILDAVHSLATASRLIPSGTRERRACLRRHALANSGLDKAVRAFVERFRTPNEDTAASEKADRDAIQRMLAHVEPEVEQWPEDRFDIGDIAFACLLGYWDFRFPELPLGERLPLLEKWFARVSERTSVRTTVPIA